jgi:NADH:ubiquinone oxidoreductase subunit 4 (subunit M)
MYQRFVFGLPKGAVATAGHGHDAHAHDAHASHAHDDHAHATPDLSWRELAACVPLVIFMVWIGLQPMHFMKMSEKTMYQMSDDLLRMKNPTLVVSPERASR